MDYKEIQELIKTINESELYSLEIESEGTHIKMSKGPEQVVLNGVAPVVQTTAKPSEETEISKQPETSKTEAPVKKETAKQEDLYVIKSPIVGTFYGSASPEKPDYVSVGTKVNKGSILCILEAMKLMNEIKSDVEGEIVEVLVKSEDMVEYGQALFKIRESGK